MPRTARIAPGGTVFHIINRGNNQRRIFSTAADYLAFLSAIAEVQQHYPTRLLSYCVMPNHWHLLLWPREDGELGRFMQRLTVTHVRRWHQHRKSTGTGHLYQGTYKSFPVQSDPSLVIVGRYIERNPLRANLVKRAQDWRWSSLWQRLNPDDTTSTPAAMPEAAAGRAALTGADDDATDDSSDSRGGGEARKVVLGEWPIDLPADWVKLVNAPQTSAEVDSVRQSIARGRPFGTAEWQQRTGRKLGLEHTFRNRGRPPKKRV